MHVAPEKVAAIGMPHAVSVVIGVQIIEAIVVRI
jgi:hypothetical protein